ncbi:MAG: IS21 family transposase [Thermodesulfobacteriota bacterium]|nr:IS21 family transposase [Thermodesulfobacteriota bacterium]
MIDYDTFCNIKQLNEQEGLKVSQISDKLNLDPRTVTHWLDCERFQPRKNNGRSSILDPFKAEIKRLIEKHPYTATQVFQFLQELGYTGGYNTVKRYVRVIRPKRSPAFLKLSFAPGECAQVDWGSCGSVPVGNTRRRLSFFAMVLCYSRMLYVEFTVSQTMEHWLACHEHAFDFFGGVPSRIMVDNLKSAVLRRIVGQAPVFNTTYLDFARHWGFDISACNVRKGNEKGIVERGVGYVKKNFLSGLEIKDFHHLQPACRQWMDTICNVRVHGETKKQPQELFAGEKPSLQSLPAHGYDIGVVKQVRASSQFRVSVDSNRYSVPAQYAGAALTMKLYPDRVCFYHQEQLIARHVRCYDRHQDFENPEHPKPLLAQRRKAKNQQVIKRFMMLSPLAVDYYQALENKRMNPLIHVRKIVALSEIHGIEPVRRAMEDAFSFQAFSSEYIANILEQRKNVPVQPAALQLTRREDLLDLEVQAPDMTIYQRNIS